MIVTDIFKAALYSVGLVPKKTIKGIVAGETQDRLTAFQTLFTSIARKVIFAVAGGWIAGLISKGLLTQADADMITEAAIAAAFMVGSAAWSKIIVPAWKNRIWPWIEKKIGPA